LLLTTNSTNANHSGQFSCLWFTKNWRYYSNSWFICSICLSVCGWKDIDSLVLISNILFNFLINSATNCSLWSKTTLSSNSCNFHILSLDNFTDSSTNISFVVITKYVILNKLLQTTRITFFLAIRCSSYQGIKVCGIWLRNT